MVFWAMCTVCSIGSNSFSALNLMPMAAKLAQLLYCFVVAVVDSFMMMLLLLLRFHSTIGMAHHPSFGTLLFWGSRPLICANFSYLESVILLSQNTQYLSHSNLTPHP